MSLLALRLKQRHSPRLDLRAIVPDRLLKMSLGAICQLQVAAEGTDSTLGDWFDVQDGERDRLLLIGDLARCDHIAGGMRDGEMEVEGSVGNFLASGMRGGRLIVNGTAGIYAGSSQIGGLVEVRGDVGDYAAAAPPGESRGMRGGTLVIGGDAGSWLASRMRRGTVIVLGSIAEGCASRMIAGTVVAAGHVALPIGYAISRGTLILLNPPPAIGEGGIAGFTQPADCELSFMSILLREVAPFLPASQAAVLATASWKRSLGDRAEQGHAEILFRDTTCL